MKTKEKKCYIPHDKSEGQGVMGNVIKLEKEMGKDQEEKQGQERDERKENGTQVKSFLIPQIQKAHPVYTLFTAYRLNMKVIFRIRNMCISLT